MSTYDGTRFFVAHVRYAGQEHGLGFQVKALETFQVVPFCSEAELDLGRPPLLRRPLRRGRAWSSKCYRGTSIIRNSPSPQDNRRALGKVLL